MIASWNPRKVIEFWYREYAPEGVGFLKRSEVPQMKPNTTGNTTTTIAAQPT